MAIVIDEKEEDDLPSPELIDMELARWKSKFQGKQVKIIPDCCAKAIKVCDKVTQIFQFSMYTPSHILRV